MLKNHCFISHFSSTERPVFIRISNFVGTVRLSLFKRSQFLFHGHFFIVFTNENVNSSRCLNLMYLFNYLLPLFFQIRFILLPENSIVRIYCFSLFWFLYFFGYFLASDRNITFQVLKLFLIEFL